MFAAGRIVTTQSASSPLQHVAADNNDSEDIVAQTHRLRQQRKRHKRCIARWFGLVRVDQSKIIADRKASDDKASAVNQIVIESTGINQMLIDEVASVNEMLIEATREY